MVLQQPARSIPVPALESGDRLTRAEFERRYAATPEKFKAELIEGVVYVASPVTVFHGTLHAALITWLGVYRAATPGISAADNTTTRLDLDNEPQPDVLLRIEIGGTSTISDDGYIEGAPELVAEIATSSATIDLGAKKNAYRISAYTNLIGRCTYLDPPKSMPLASFGGTPRSQWLPLIRGTLKRILSPPY
jgi:Uma2 family endonuclease